MVLRVFFLVSRGGRIPHLGCIDCGSKSQIFEIQGFGFATCLVYIHIVVAKIEHQVSATSLSFFGNRAFHRAASDLHFTC
jgi:hypothetical protein